jgi:hypothetical protein
MIEAKSPLFQPEGQQALSTTKHLFTKNWHNPSQIFTTGEMNMDLQDLQDER